MANALRELEIRRLKEKLRIALLSSNVDTLVFVGSDYNPICKASDPRKTDHEHG
jgi:hypothetical protein